MSSSSSPNSTQDQYQFPNLSNNPNVNANSNANASSEESDQLVMSVEDLRRVQETVKAQQHKQINLSSAASWYGQNVVIVKP